MEPIVLTGKKELDIYVNPQRQNILRCMQIAGVPMSAKQIADQVGISASSVQRHIRLLRELGIVEQSHTEQIHGITATYFRVLPRNVRIGGLKDDDAIVFLLFRRRIAALLKFMLMCEIL